MRIERLSNEHLPLVGAFSCIESEEQLKQYNSKERRRIKKHSKEMDDFLKEEAWEDQEFGLSTTFLLMEDDKEKIVAYISLCNDAIRLDFDEKNEKGFPYFTIPALKIARLAVSSAHQKKGIGRKLIFLAAYQGINVRQASGVVFITLDCYEHRKSFYEAFGFVENNIQPEAREFDNPISMRIHLDKLIELFE